MLQADKYAGLRGFTLNPTRAICTERHEHEGFNLSTMGVSLLVLLMNSKVEGFALELTRVSCAGNLPTLLD